MTELLQNLRKRGDYVSIDNGRLVIKPVSGKDVPLDWLKKVKHELLDALIQESGRAAYYYHDYRTGKFHKGVAGGIMLILFNAITQQEITVFFNADVTYQRASHGHEKGDLRPDGEFYVYAKSSFLKFWKICGLKIPRGRVSELHKYMGMLKEIVFTGEIEPINGKKILTSSLKPYNSIQSGVVDAQKFVDSVATIKRQDLDNKSTMVFDNELQKYQKQSVLQRNLSAWSENRVSKLTRNDVSTGYVHSIDNTNTVHTLNCYPEEGVAHLQSVDAWLDDYASSMESIVNQWEEKIR